MIKAMKICKYNKYIKKYKLWTKMSSQVQKKCNNKLKSSKIKLNNYKK